MDPFAQVLEVLIGKKVQSGTNWRVYDEADNEIADPGGIMMRANPGALIMWPGRDGFGQGAFKGVFRFGFSGYKG